MTDRWPLWVVETKESDRAWRVEMTTLTPHEFVCRRTLAIFSKFTTARLPVTKKSVPR